MRNRPASTLRRPLAASVLVGAVGLLAGASPAMAGFKDCAVPGGGPAPAPPTVIADIGAPIEGMVVDNAGRLWVTDLTGGRVIRFDRPGAPATVVATIPGGGGGALELLPNGTVIVGSGADPRVLFGDVLKPGAISTVDPVTGALVPLAKGFSAANGFAVSRDGTIYATNDFASLIGKRAPNGKITTNWASLPSANGAALDKAQKYLYVSRTFYAPGVTRIPIANPKEPERVLTLQGTDVFAAPDGLTLDSQDRPVVPTNAAGEIIRIDAPEKACKLAKGLQSPSVVAYGKGSVGFSKGRLFAAGFGNKVYEVPAAFDAGA